MSCAFLKSKNMFMAKLQGKYAS